MPWNYTWITGRDPNEAFMSNNNNLSYQRYTIFNDNWESIAFDASRNWGKF